MTKDDIVNALTEELKGLPKKEAASIVELIFQTIKSTLESGEEVKLSGFGNFSTKSKRERTGRNPQTGEPLTISARTVVKFKPSDVLKKKINKDS